MAHDWDFGECRAEQHYSCIIKELDEDGELLEEYWRGFLVDGYSREDYLDFVYEFCDNELIRDKYNLRHHYYTRRFNDGTIDENLYEVLVKLNEMGIKTLMSCQGTDQEWTDYPCPTDGHSVTAYIGVENIPETLKKALENNDKVALSEKGFYAKGRKNNKDFATIILNAL